ncbi:MAG: ATP-dependent RNA helicase HrpA [Fibrobacteraceae bacterium]
MNDPLDYTQLKIEYPDLPVVKRRLEFLELLKKHQVVIVKADTGSGKSTQVPKFLLESGLAGEKRIGITEPRRLAALSIADRLREELKDENLVATRIRFLEEGPKRAPIKVMTDGILLQEFRHDRLFKAYSAIMIDEAHERSLNIDILLGIFKSVLKVRPEFRLIIASATLDAKLFEQFYENATVLEAEGRMFPVKVIFADPNENASKSKGDSGLVEEACDAIIALEETVRKDNLLCFLPTERDIQDLIAELLPKLDEKKFEVLPLFGRMSPQEQRRVFHSAGKTRIVLATNIAETSLTIPGIAYVVDTGTARVSRYNPQTRIQGLPVEKVSQASARQRTGRAGRVKPGVCVRLYTEEDFNDREEFTEPEIRRSNLSNVVLQLRSLGLSVEDFPFVQPPPRSAFRGAYKTLFELGALSSTEKGAEVTPFGVEMSKLPMDVALSAVLLRARDSGVFQPAIIVCSGLSIQDPRLYPSEEGPKEKARAMHRALGGHKSDFLTLLALWNSFCREWKGTSWNLLRKFAEKHYLHFLRCREWIDLYEQFCRILKVEFKDYACPFDSFHRDNLHIALLSGFLGGIAERDRDNGCYRLVGGRDAYIFPGSDLAGKGAEFVLSAEIRETSRVFLTKAAEIKPEWVIQVAKDFCTRRWFEPKWNPERGFVEAVEEVSFRGMVLSRSRRVDYGRVNADDAARIFFLEAIVGGDLPRPFPFMEHNEQVLESLRGKEARLRRWGICPSDDIQVDYLMARAPGVFSLKTLKDFISNNTDKVLRYDESAWFSASTSGMEHLESFKNNPTFGAAFRKCLEKEEAEKKASFHGGMVEFLKLLDREVRAELVFDSSKAWDGLTLEIPAELLPRLSPAIFAASVGKWREWMEESFIRELPKGLRKKAETAKLELDDRFIERLEKNSGKAPLLLLYEAFESIGDFDGGTPTLNPQKEHHLRLHLFVTSKQMASKFPVELSPEWGACGWFSRVRTIVQSCALNMPVMGVNFAWRLGDSLPMNAAEANFWQRFFARLKGTANESNAVKSLLESRIAFLNKKDEDGWLLRSLLAMTEEEQKKFTPDFLEMALPRFSGVEFARAHKVHSFGDISSKMTDAESDSREGLLRLVSDSAYLGISPFVSAWGLFHEAFMHFRRRTPIADGILKLSLLLSTEESLYRRFCIIAEFLKFENFAKSSEKLNLCSVKEMRERFQPYFAGRLLKDYELREAREKISAIENAKTENDSFESHLAAENLLENFALLRYKRAFLASAPEEKVEKSSLIKLKGQFGSL